jgi:hypothetical protein
MGKSRFQFRWSIQVFLALSALEGLLIFAPANGVQFHYWMQTSIAGLFLLAALAWFTIPETIVAKRP